MIAKFVTAAVLGAAVTAGTTAPAFAAASGSSGSSSPAVSCTRAQQVVDRLTKVDVRITTVLPKLQAAETKAEQAGHSKLAARIEKRIGRLQKLRSRDEKRIARIEGRCPGVTASSGTSSSATAA